jgi:hypothetical protein
MPAWLSPVEEHSYDAATFHVYRAVVFADALAHGNAFPRWVQPINAGLGGPLFSFYPPLTYYLLAGLHAPGIPFPLAWRLVVGLAMAIAAAGVYAVTVQITRRAVAGLAAAAIFLFSLPLLRELLERGAPEGLAVALYPWVLWGLVRMIRRPSGFNLAIASLLWAALILTHHLAAAFLVPVLILTALLFSGRREGDWVREDKPPAEASGPRCFWALGILALMLLLGTALSAFFLIPFLLERGFVRMDNVIALDYARALKNAVPLRDLLALPPPYDTGLDNNSIGEHIGPLVALILVGGLLAGALLATTRRDWRWLAVAVFSLLGLIIVWLQTPAANAVWEALPILAYVQIRTRMLGVAALCAALVVGLALGEIRGRWQAGLGGAAVLASLLLALPLLYPALQYRYTAFEPDPTAEDAASFALRENVPGLTAFNEFLPVWRHLAFTPAEAVNAAASVLRDLPPGARVLAQEWGGDRLLARVESPVPFDTQVHQLYFPGWVATVSGERRALLPAEGTGYIVLKGLPTGNQTIELRYEGTGVQHTATWVSAIALLGLVVGTAVWRGGRLGGANPIAVVYPKTNWWLVVGLAVLLAGKTLWLDPFTTLLRRASTCSEVTGATSSAAVRFGEHVRLCAVEIGQRSIRAGDPLQVNLYWQVDSPVEQPAASFVHLLGTAFNPRSGNPLWGQQEKDAPGSHSLSRWTPGKVYRDSYEFQVDPAAPAGEYALEIGWFEPESGERLKPTLESPAGAQGMRLSDLDSLLIPGIIVR